MEDFDNENQSYYEIIHNVIEEQSLVPWKLDLCFCIQSVGKGEGSLGSHTFNLWHLRGDHYYDQYCQYKRITISSIYINCTYILAGADTKYWYTNWESFRRKARAFAKGRLEKVKKESLQSLIPHWNSGLRRKLPKDCKHSHLLSLRPFSLLFILSARIFMSLQSCQTTLA
jgi:hypothetical protein